MAKVVINCKLKFGLEQKSNLICDLKCASFQSGLELMYFLCEKKFELVHALDQD